MTSYHIFLHVRDMQSDQFDGGFDIAARDRVVQRSEQPLCAFDFCRRQPLMLARGPLRLSANFVQYGVHGDDQRIVGSACDRHHEFSDLIMGHVIGHGGSGTVRRAQHRTKKTGYALKIISMAEGQVHQIKIFNRSTIVDSDSRNNP